MVRYEAEVNCSLDWLLVNPPMHVGLQCARRMRWIMLCVSLSDLGLRSRGRRAVRCRAVPCPVQIAVTPWNECVPWRALDWCRLRGARVEQSRYVEIRQLQTAAIFYKAAGGDVSDVCRSSAVTVTGSGCMGERQSPCMTDSVRIGRPQHGLE